MNIKLEAERWATILRRDAPEFRWSYYFEHVTPQMELSPIAFVVFRAVLFSVEREYQTEIKVSPEFIDLSTDPISGYIIGAVRYEFDKMLDQPQVKVYG